MQFLYEIPAEFWSLFRSGNRDVYIEALLAIIFISPLVWVIICSPSMTNISITIIS